MRWQPASRAVTPTVDDQCAAVHPRGIIVCDEDATDELKVGTYKYFKDIEAKNLDPASLGA
ncbi:MAG: hypothetical protein ACLR76_00105 [Alistipes sp.]